MYNLKFHFVCLVAAIFNVSAMAQNPTTSGTYCGSGWSAWVVPDNVRLLGCSYGDGCKEHDVCYSQCEGRTDSICKYRRCLPGGDLVSNGSVCAEDAELVFSIRQAERRRGDCDTNFGKKLRGANENKQICVAVANMYEKAVKKWGIHYFHGIDPESIPPATTQSQAEYETALRDFLTNATEEQLRLFNEGQETGRGVNLKKPIRFISDRGLENIPAVSR